MEEEYFSDEDIREESPVGGGDSGEEPIEEEHFDITLAASHSYMGAGLAAVRGRGVVEAGWEGAVPLLARRGAVFPGEAVPVLLPHPHDAALLADALRRDKLFGLLCPDESGMMISGYGVLCEVFEAAVEGEGGEAWREGGEAWREGGEAWREGGEARQAGGEAAQARPQVVSCKARATHRIRCLDVPRDSVVSLHTYARVRVGRVRVLADVRQNYPLCHARLTSLDPMRHPNNPCGSRLRAMDAVVTPWPLFLYDMFNYEHMRRVIVDYFKTIMLDKLPEEPVSLSFWVASNLALGPRERLALLLVDNALHRLHMEVHLIQRKSALCCTSCQTEITRRHHMFPMSSEGVSSNYTNLGGYLHDVVTVTRTTHTVLSGAPSEEYSWFPGYAWTILLCRGCRDHVGWRFDAVRRSLRPQRFYGLCRNQVRPNDARDRLPY